MVPEVRISTENAQLLREEPAEALEDLFAAIQDEGMELALTSAYRPMTNSWRSTGTAMRSRAPSRR